MKNLAVPGRPVYCALLPHAPILVPGVGGACESEAGSTISAMREAARRALTVAADVLIVVSPHSPRVPESLGIWAGERLRGSLHAFGFADRMIDLPADGAFTDQVASLCRQRGLGTALINETGLDHGATVPLWFLAEAGWQGPIVVLGLSTLAPCDLMAAGEAIAEAASYSGKRVAVIASGDMSHRLTVDSPHGRDERGVEFDRWFIKTLQQRDYQALLHPEPEIEEAAMQDALDSVLVAVRAVDFSSTGAEVLHYEGPFGVGYGVAILYREQSDSARS